jgi:hypothetical protein
LRQIKEEYVHEDQKNDYMELMLMIEELCLLVYLSVYINPENGVLLTQQIYDGQAQGVCWDSGAASVSQAYD